MGWTKAQQKVIDIRNKNLLVSAAAGSGKTAVLVERIISMISEGSNPIDIDRLLVVTFTNAAAGEMRERIGKAIDAKLMKDPENQHLQRQVSLLQSAQITTIHSFCLNVIRNYFHRIDLDPSFKIAEDSEITLMKSDVIANILERWYEEGREDFHAFVESYSYSKSDIPIEELILMLYNFSMSNPWPESWIAGMKKMFELETLEEMSAAPWMKELKTYVSAVLKDLSDKNQEALSLCNESCGPAAYLPALLSDAELLEGLSACSSYDEQVKSFMNISFARLSSKKQDEVSEEKKEQVKALREEMKKGIKELVNQFFFQMPEEMLKDIQSVKGIIGVLFELTLEFMTEFAKKKEEKNLIDFNDLEHFALKILVSEPKEDGAVVPTPAAQELAEQFEEILIDEYQDSNLVQETILKSISMEESGAPNRFMVGDVKQSIYKFRLAMPEIFMEKYDTYSCEDFLEEGKVNFFQRIDLDKNFRSRKLVLDYVNMVFEQIMQRPVGGIVYDEAAALKYGGLYEDDGKNKSDNRDGSDTKKLDDRESMETAAAQCFERQPLDVEMLLVTEEEVGVSLEEREAKVDVKTDTQADTADQNEIIYTKKEIEARVIARRIKELTNPENGMMIFDKAASSIRPAIYRDIVILLRSMSNWSEIFVNTLLQEGISAYAETGTGYFQTLEIMTILNMLRIIDNPRQDIPLMGVLYSPMGGISAKELASIRSYERNVSLYTALLSFSQADDRHGVNEDINQDLQVKIDHFLAMLEDFRSMVSYKPIHEMIQIILDRTGYYYYVCAMPGGDQRKANIDMLISQAVRFEKGSYSGLFHFIRYIEKLHKYEVDFGEASTSGEQENTVRIMSIHKSKGLEFPIVFVAGMSKQFNTQDLRKKIVLHNEMGIGPDYIDSMLRTKVPTLMKKVIQKKVQLENLGEELRVLYVAMTRAREKLILTGYLKALEEIRKKSFSFFEIISARSYLDWVLPATINRIGWEPEIRKHMLFWRRGEISITVYSRKEFLWEEVAKQIFSGKDQEKLLAANTEDVYDQKLRDAIRERFHYQYPHQNEAGLKVKMTVSELKKIGQFQDEEHSVNLYRKTAEKDHLETATVPDFISGKEKVLTGSDRGTLYHKVLELIDLSRIETQQDLLKELNRLIEDGHIETKELGKLNTEYIYNFTLSEAAKRMRKAAVAQKLYKEKQFVFGVKASEVMPNTESDELILIQGIIDTFFEEDGELVLLDYKSDHVFEEELLVKRYKVQLAYYRRALEQMFQMKVKEIILYSLPLGKEIRID